MLKLPREVRFIALGLVIGSWGVAPATTAEVVHIGTLPGLRFDVTTFSVRPGATVELVFTNRDEMAHNLVITTPGARLEVVNAAMALGAGAMERNFVPDLPEVLWATKIVPGGQSATLTFTAPEAPAEYPFVCTYPGHGLLMFGAMIVTPDPGAIVLTPVDAPAPGGEDHHAMARDDHVAVTPSFMPDSGPASIAVRLPGGYAYCWDAGACRFRYAWRGGYVAIDEYGVSKIVGEIFQREEAGFPLRVGPDPEHAPAQVLFRDYVLSSEGYPEFEYVVDGLTVYERVIVQDGSVVRSFRTHGEGATVWFAIPPDGARRYLASGVRDGAFFKFDGGAAREFVIVYNSEVAEMVP